MVGAWGDWWLGHDGRWRQGSPPPGWRRARDGIWYPADRVPGQTDDTINMSGGTYGARTVQMHDRADEAGETPYGAHLSRADHADRDERDADGPHRPAPYLRGWVPAFSSWPVWARVGAPAAAALVLLAGLLAVSEMLRGGDDAPASGFGPLGPSASTPLGPATASSSTSSTSTTTTTEPTTTTSTTAPPATASPAPPVTARPPEPDVLYRNCNQVRAAGADPLSPGDPGYDRALDTDGDGLACDPDDGPGRGPP